jgi:hypothetical protein
VTALVTARNQANRPPTKPPPTGTIRTTSQLTDEHTIPVAGALDLPESSLPIDPYVLGVWLGDGNTTSGIITSADPEVINEIEMAGYTCRRVPSSLYGWRVEGLTTQLRRLGVLGDKHIPRAYLRSSTKQRLALLQGLMDTDGHACASGAAEFTGTRRGLVDEVLELIISLGHKATITEGRATIDGRDCGPKYRIKWTPPDIVFRLARKADRQKLPGPRSRVRWRRIRTVEPIPSTPVRCIEVTSPSRLYLAGSTMIPTHNSHGLLMDTLHDCEQYPGLEAWWVREDYPQLRDSVIADLEKLNFCRHTLGCRWNGSDKILRFPNGSLIRFRHARNLSDAGQMLSAACQKLIFDERTTLDPDVVEKLSTRVRSGRPGVPVIGVRSASNPGGRGHSAVKAQFVDPAPLGRQRLTALDSNGDPIILDDGRTLDRYFLPARIDDNPAGKAVDPTYAARFAMMNPDLAAAYRDGDWGRFEGMRFSTFDLRRHVVPAGQIDLPLGGIRRGLGIDWGSAAPFAAVWGAILNEQVIVYRELHETQLTPTEQAALVLANERDGERLPQRPIPTWIDPATWAKSPDKPLAKPIDPNSPVVGSIAHGYRTAGVPVERAFNDRVPGWALLDELLTDLPDGRPRLVISDMCPNVIRSFSGAPRSNRNPEDVDEHYRDDHALDALRYLCAGLFRSGIRREPRRRRTRATVKPVTAGLGKAGL